MCRLDAGLIFPPRACGIKPPRSLRPGPFVRADSAQGPPPRAPFRAVQPARVSCSAAAAARSPLTSPRSRRAWSAPGHRATAPSARYASTALRLLSCPDTGPTAVCAPFLGWIGRPNDPCPRGLLCERHPRRTLPALCRAHTNTTWLSPVTDHITNGNWAAKCPSPRLKNNDRAVCKCSQVCAERWPPFRRHTAAHSARMRTGKNPPKFFPCT